MSSSSSLSPPPLRRLSVVVPVYNEIATARIALDALLAGRRDTVVAVSPIVAGSALKGPADRMLTELGHEASVVGVAWLYAPVCATLVVDARDADRVAEVEREGVRCVVTDTIMSTPSVAAALAEVTVRAAGGPVGPGVR